MAKPDPYFSKEEVRKRVISMFQMPKPSLSMGDRLREVIRRRKPKLPRI